MPYIGAGLTRFNTADELTVTGDAQIDTTTLVVDSTNNLVGIGTASPSEELTVSKSDDARISITSSGTSKASMTGLLEFDGSDGRHGYIGPVGGVMTLNTDGGYDIKFQPGGTEKVRITSGGNVGIGTSSPSQKLSVVESGGSARMELLSGTSGTSIIDMGDTSDADIGGIRYENTNNAMLFRANNDERMRITDGGHLLVGKTSQDSTNTVGFEAKNTGDIAATVDGSVTAYFNRKTSDGDIAVFRKDNTTLGSIASRAGVVSTLVLNPASGNGAGLSGGTKAVVPADEAGIVDDDISLGVSTHRFNDLYLSGGAYLGGTAAANYLDDYETGTFTISQNVGTATADAQYIKIGDVCIVTVNVRDFSDRSNSSNIRLGNLPFTSASTNFYAAGGVMGRYVSAGNNGIVYYINPASTDIRLFALLANGNWTDLQHSHLSNTNAQFIFTATYRTA